MVTFTIHQLVGPGASQNLVQFSRLAHHPIFPQLTSQKFIVHQLESHQLVPNPLESNQQVPYQPFDRDQLALHQLIIAARPAFL